MTKKLKKMVITLCIGALALCGFVIGSKIIENNQQEPGVAVNKDLTKYAADEIVSVKVQLKNGEYYYVTEDASQSSGSTVVYKVTFNGVYEGLEYDESLAKQVVSYAALLSTTRDMGAQSEDVLSVFGLDEPVSTVTVALATGKEDVIYIGNMASGGTGYFCKMKGDDHVYVISPARGETLTTSVNGMRISKFVPIQALEETEKMEWQFNDGPYVSFYRDLEASIFNPTVNFYVDSPWKAPMPVNGETIEEVVSGMPVLEISGYVTPKADGSQAVLSEYGLDDPWGYFKLTGQDGSVMEMAFGDFIDEETKYECYMLDKSTNHIYIVNYAKASYLEDYTHFNITSPYVSIANMNDIEYVIAEYDGMKSVFKHERLSNGTDNDGNVVYDSKYTLDGMEYEKDALGLLYRNAIAIKIQNQYKEGYEYEKEPMMVLTYVPFDTDEEPRVLKFYKINDDICAAEINGVLDIMVSVSDVQDYIDAVQIVKDGGRPPYKF